MPWGWWVSGMTQSVTEDISRFDMRYPARAGRRPVLHGPGKRKRKPRKRR